MFTDCNNEHDKGFGKINETLWDRNRGLHLQLYSYNYFKPNTQIPNI